MENTPYLYDTLLDVLSQHAKWLDRRHRQTLAWMMVGLISSKTVSLGEWAPFVVSCSARPQADLPDPNDPLSGSPIGFSGLHSMHFRNGSAAPCASSGQGLHNKRSEATRTQNNRSGHG